MLWCSLMFVLLLVCLYSHPKTAQLMCLGPTANLLSLCCQGNTRLVGSCIQCHWHALYVDSSEPLTPYGHAHVTTP
jgi:hypothetical protein